MITKKQRRKNQALVRFARNGQEVWAEDIIDMGANVNCRTKRTGWTPLHWAAVHANCRGIIRSLVAKGADINAIDNEGNTPLEAALKYGTYIGDTVVKLIDLGAKLPSDWESTLERNPWVDSYQTKCVIQYFTSL